MTATELMPILIPAAFVAAIALRSRRERPLDADRLWIMPLIVAALIGMGLYFAPHPPFGVGAYLAMGLAGVAGAAFGVWRARVTVLRHDIDSGRLMASQSGLAIAVLVGVFLLRFGARQALGEGAAVAGDASMVFALGMVVALRVALWRRARAFALLRA